MYLHEDLTKKIIAAIIRVHQVLGPGFLESHYQKALIIELRKGGIDVTFEQEMIVLYEGIEIGRHRYDLLVEGKIMVELKAVEELNRTHYATLRAYLRATGLRVGLLANFSKEMADYRRIEL